MVTDGQILPVCLRQVIEPVTTTSTIQSAIFVKPSVLLGYDARDAINPNFGSRECHSHMLCHVWIGENARSNQSEFERREWYWAYQFNNQTIEPWIPIRLVNTRLDAQHKPIALMETNLYKYRTNPLTEFEVDGTIADCYRALGPTVCRGSTMHCVIYTMLLTNYPPMMNPETGMPSGQNWDETHIEYAWSKRDSVFTPQANKSKVLDYPVSLFLRTYQRTTTSTGTEYRSEEIEYEFFEMSTDLPNDGFDVSVCYRSRDWPYLHLAFTVKLNKGNMADSNHLNRKELYDRFLLMLQTAMTPISSTRIHQLEIDHDITSALDTLYVMFLLLGPAPTADPIPSNIPLTTPRPIDQLSVEAAREQLRNPPDHGGLGNIQISSEYIVYVIREMYERANRRRVNIIGHSQGDMTPQWAFRFWSDTRSMVNSMICLAMTNHEIDRQLSDDDLPSWIPARWHFSHGSQVMCALNSFREAFDDQIFYTQIMTCYDNTHYYTA
ncbi:unnamed protein product [Rotaria sordida]|uniref:Uncharacterized protein n=1 Tax=Rotaria sordida TaxID=392033 RepID=A0A818NV02_9BILA|nr:unnamed protein product [Rotaria sordida]